MKTMNQCTAVRSRGSLHPCQAPALRGVFLCGRHAKMKHPPLWTTAHQSRTPPLVRVQAVVRGWLLRRRLRLAGPGVLCRRGLSNDDDFATCVELTRISPLEYIGFEENGKRWGFSFASLWTWSTRSITPVNPYTKVALSVETRTRLRAIWTYRFRRGIPSSFESQDLSSRVRSRWTVLCQHFNDSGFVEVSLETLLDFSSADWMTMFAFLERDLECVLPPTHPFRTRLIGLCHRRTESLDASARVPYPLRCANTLLYMLSLPSDSYALTFSILSALYRC